MRINCSHKDFFCLSMHICFKYMYPLILSDLQAGFMVNMFSSSGAMAERCQISNIC